MRPPLPQRLIDQAHAFSTGQQTPAEPRNAATVVLLRDGHQLAHENPADDNAVPGPEVYLLRRQASMAFAAGMCVFPGGGVDPRDFDASLSGRAWAGPDVPAWATALGTEDDLARALVCAAVRETFEESGVLLAGPSPTEVVADTTGDDWEADRQALEARELAFTDFLTNRGLVLRTDLLGAWSGWLTPIFEPRRFRTWFFVARLPEGQITRDVSSESASVHWRPALEAVRAVEQQELGMMPPTYLTCLDIGRYDGADAVLAAARDRRVSIFMPEVVPSGEEFILSSPPEYDALLRERAGQR